MGRVNLVCAPAASGKTQHVLRRARELLAERPLAPVWVIVPDRHQARAFRDRLARAGGALGSTVGTFGDLYAEVLARAGDYTPEAPAGLVQRLLRAAVRDVAEAGQLQHYRSIQDRPGLAAALDTWFDELKQARVEPDALESALAGRGPRLEELARIYHAYQHRLLDGKLADRQGISWLAARALEAYPGLLADIPFLAIDGFNRLDPTQLLAVRLLAGQIPEVLLTLTREEEPARQASFVFQRTLEQARAGLQPAEADLPAGAPPRPAGLEHLRRYLFASSAPRAAPGPEVKFLAAQSQALEAREAVRWIKRLHIRENVPLEECAVTAGSLAPYRAHLRAAAREFGVPLRFASEETLDANPAVAAALNLLSLHAGGWPFRGVLDAARSPYFDLTGLGLRAGDAAALESIARWGQVVAGRDQWEAALDLAGEAAQPEPDDDEAGFQSRPELAGRQPAEIKQALAAWMDRCARDQTAPAAEHARWTEALLDNLRFNRLDHTGARDRAAEVGFRDVLRGIVAEEAILPGPALAWPAFLQELRGALGGVEYRALPSPGAPMVYAAALGAARGVPYQAVAVLGLAEGVLPQPNPEDPFLSDRERDELEGALKLEPRRRANQPTLFYETVACASSWLLLTRPYQTDAGDDWPASIYWQSAFGLFDLQPEAVAAWQPRPLAEAASAAELLTLAGPDLPASFETALGRDERPRLERARQVWQARLDRAAGGIFEGDLSGAPAAASLEQRYGPDHVWSASRLEAYAGCPFRFLVDSDLKLELREPPAAGLDLAQRGLVLHELLKEIYQTTPAAKRAGLKELSRPLRRRVEALLESAPRRHGFRPLPWWEHEKAEIVELLERNLQAMADDEDEFVPGHFERAFGLRGEPPAQLVIPGEADMLFHGVIDRVDVAGRRLRVVDYKSSSQRISATELEGGERLQLVIYALAAEALFDGAVDDGFYWHLGSARPSSLDLAGFKAKKTDRAEAPGMQQAAAVAREHLSTHRRKIRAGDFKPRPPDEGCPVYCPARLFCWRYDRRYAG